MRPRTIVFMSIAAAMFVFVIVQDRVTAAGARRYVAGQREARAAGGVAPTIDQVMPPAIHRSVEQGILWGGLVLGAGCASAAAVSRKSNGARP